MDHGSVERTFRTDTRLVIAEHFHFHKRNQAAGESVAQFIAELRRLARYCEFKTFLNEALRDRFVCGLSSKAIQNSLLKKPEGTDASQGH